MRETLELSLLLRNNSIASLQCARNHNQFKAFYWADQSERSRRSFSIFRLELEQQKERHFAIDCQPGSPTFADPRSSSSSTSVGSFVLLVARVLFPARQSEWLHYSCYTTPFQCHCLVDFHTGLQAKRMSFVAGRDHFAPPSLEFAGIPTDAMEAHGLGTALELRDATEDRTSPPVRCASVQGVAANGDSRKWTRS